MTYDAQSQQNNFVLLSNIRSLFWTTRCEKGLLSFNPLAFTHVPPDMTTSKLCGDSILGNSGGHFVYEIYGLFRKDISDFQLFCGRFSPTET
jgi:hypothetical protein